MSKILLFLNITTCKTKHPTHEPTGALTDQIQTIKTLLTEWMESLQLWLITPLNSSLFLERSHAGRSESWTWTVVNHLHQRPSQLWAWCLWTLTNSTHCFCVAAPQGLCYRRILSVHRAQEVGCLHHAYCQVVRPSLILQTYQIPMLFKIIIWRTGFWREDKAQY